MATVLIIQAGTQARADMAATLRVEGHAVLEADTAGKAVAMARAEQPDIVLLDPLLPDRSGYELYAALQQDDATSAIPVLFLPTQLAGQPPSQVPGAESPSIVTRLGVALRTKALHDDLRSRDTSLREAILTDSLTGLANRRALEEQLQAETEKAATASSPLSLVLADLDNFAGVNELWGYAVGDQALQAFAGLLHSSCRDNDTLGRFEGASFLLLLPKSPVGPAWHVAERLRQQTAALGSRVGTGGLHLAASFGVAAHQEGDTWRDLLGRTVAALQRAKRAGRNRCEVS